MCRRATARQYSWLPDRPAGSGVQRCRFMEALRPTGRILTVTFRRAVLIFWHATGLLDLRCGAALLPFFRLHFRSLILLFVWEGPRMRPAALFVGSANAVAFFPKYAKLHYT